MTITKSVTWMLADENGTPVMEGTFAEMLDMNVEIPAAVMQERCVTTIVQP